MKTVLRQYFREIICLTVDHRFSNVNNTRIANQLGTIPRFLLVGNGDKYPADCYFHIDTNPIPEWSGTRQSYNYCLCWFELIALAKANNWENFLFVEDDIEVQNNFDDVFLHTIAECPDDWDMLYFGGNHHSSLTEQVAPHLLRASCCLDMHAVAVNRSMYNALSAVEYYPHLKGNPYFDVTVAHLFHWCKRIFASWPAVVYQRPGISFNELEFLDRTSNWQHPGNLLTH